MLLELGVRAGDTHRSLLRGNGAALLHDINETAKPRYLVGLVGVITGKELERCVVQLDEPVGRYTNGEVKARALQLRPLGPE